jgi:hypothetical protein
MDKVGVLVPGQLLSARFPNYIKLDTESRELSWHTASDTWIPEDGLYDHLIIKVGQRLNTGILARNRVIYFPKSERHRTGGGTSVGSNYIGLESSTILPETVTGTSRPDNTSETRAALKRLTLPQALESKFLSKQYRGSRSKDKS